MEVVIPLVIYHLPHHLWDTIYPSIYHLDRELLPLMLPLKPTEGLTGRWAKVVGDMYPYPGPSMLQGVEVGGVAGP